MNYFFKAWGVIATSCITIQAAYPLYSGNAGPGHLHFVASDDSAYRVFSKIPQKPTVRPFITEDARVVGDRLAQLETWLRFDKESGQHWLMAAYGPTPKLELSLGGLYGYWIEPQQNGSHKKLFSYALPLVQAKYLFLEYVPNKPPGVALVIGSFFPLGRRFFVPLGAPTLLPPSPRA